jgi:hypothetical protein
MTTLGHGITGATIGVLVVPSAWRPWAKAALVVSYAVLANMPDLHVSNWGHHRYDISHSVFVNSAIVVALAVPVFVALRIRRIKEARWIVLGAAAAWLSHLLLDTFYNHHLGLAMFWPFSDARVSLTIPWFESLSGPLQHFGRRTARVLLIELASYGPLFAAALAWRWACARSKGRSTLEGRAAVW